MLALDSAGRGAAIRPEVDDRRTEGGAAVSGRRKPADPPPRRWFMVMKHPTLQPRVVTFGELEQRPPLEAGYKIWEVYVDALDLAVEEAERLKHDPA